MHQYRIARIGQGTVHYPVDRPATEDKIRYTQTEHITATVFMHELEQLEADRDDLMWVADCARRLLDTVPDSLEATLLRNALGYVHPDLRLLGTVAS